MNQYIVKKQIDIQAEPSVVWDALTNPEKTKEYFFNCRVNSDWKVVSPITFKGKIMLVKNIEMKGEILAIEHEKLLKYNLVNDDESDNPSISIVTDRLTYNNGITTLTIADDVGIGKDAEKRFERSEKGWDKILSGLKEFIEKDNTK